jgi:hypothetical protein
MLLCMVKISQPFTTYLKILQKDAVVNTLRTGDTNLRPLRYNCERRMTQNCLLTHAWFLCT